MKTEELEKLARDTALSIYNSYRNVLVGTAPQCVHDLYARFRDVRPGDLVLETTAFLMPGRSALDGLGYLLRETWEPVVFSDPDFVWDEKAEGKPHPTERCYYIRTLDGREFRWTNASFISAPTDWPMRGQKEAA